MSSWKTILSAIYKDLNVEELLKKQEQKICPYNPKSDSLKSTPFLMQFYPLAILKILFHGFLLQSGIWQKLIYSNWKFDYFYEFKQYWEEELGFRSLQPNDFWFLYGVTRLAQAEADYLDENTEADSSIFLKAWSQEIISLRLLFHNTLKLALYPLAAYRFVKFIPKGARICEYGCGLAPITNSLIKYYPYLKLKFACVDIPHLLFHYLRWRFRKCDFIECLAADPIDENPLKGRKYDVIFVLAVFKHLPKPLAIAKHLSDSLQRSGILIFDYVRSEAKGLDSHAGLRERMAVLEYILKHFSILEGEIPLDGTHVGPTSAGKLNSYEFP